MIESLQRKQPELNISDVEVLCVKVAALCHDLGWHHCRGNLVYSMLTLHSREPAPVLTIMFSAVGHGPFSHVFGDFVMPEMGKKGWKVFVYIYIIVFVNISKIFCVFHY